MFLKDHIQQLTAQPPSAQSECYHTADLFHASECDLGGKKGNIQRVWWMHIALFLDWH